MLICTASLTSVAAFFESSGDITIYIWLLLLGGPAFYFYVYSRYRNKAQRHYHEAETPVKMTNLQSYDNFFEHLTRKESPQLPGANNDSVLGSLNDLDGEFFEELSEKVFSGAVNSVGGNFNVNFGSKNRKR